jgi:hypothetical protein
LTIFNAPIREVQVLFGHQKNRTFPLDLACFEHLSVWSPADLPYDSPKQNVTNNWRKVHVYFSHSWLQVYNENLELLTTSRICVLAI